VGRKRGAKPRADEQEPDTRLRRVGRAGGYPRSRDGQDPGEVDPAVVRQRVVFLPGETSPCAGKGDDRATGRGEESAEAMKLPARGSKRPNVKKGEARLTLEGAMHRSPGSWSSRS
jgi:hypothetical protein